ncbi:c-type cytochrome [Rhizobium oryzicola]|uniref:Cytochrome c family protein n=1 Tax=Rhizobium oryzicola TaxID=1232668 RepID=A0ABT8SZU4_9HYPH|nr:cytochrome c family protein [Rhizobium oryzicola]MDO1583418.1 cytochrome c family protein [Rhizobium oryzicola]
MRPNFRDAAATVLLLILSSASALADGDAENGKKLFARCSACHAITDQNKVGPGLQNVVGRPAASEPQYKYSAALAASGLTWDEATLDTFLKAPTTLVKGTRMNLAVTKDQERADIIAYLKTLSGK